MSTIIIYNYDYANAKHLSKNYKNVSFIDENFFEDAIPEHKQAILCYDVKNKSRFAGFKLISTEPNKSIMRLEDNHVNVLPEPNLNPDVVLENEGIKCIVCGKVFIPKNKNQKYCSKECRLKK